VKILFVDQTGQLGGGELSLLDVIRCVRHPSQVVLFSDGPFRNALESIPVPVHLLSLGKISQVPRNAQMRSALSALPHLFALRRQLASQALGSDLIYANSQKAFIVSALARRRRQPLIWHLRDILTADHFSPLMRRAAVLAGNLSASAVIVNSEATRDAFVKAGGKREKTFIVYNGIDPQPFDAVSSGEVDALREEFNLKGKFVFGVFGRLTPWKGQRVAIDAIVNLPDVELLLVGDALFGEQPFVEQLRQHAQTLGVRNRVHFLGFRQDVPALMKLVDVVVHASTLPEPFGRVIVEGMLATRPVVAMRAGGVLEIVQDSETGLLVSPDSPQTLTAAIARLQQDPAFARRIAAAGHQRARQVFSVDAMIDGIHAVIDAVLADAAR